MKRHARDRATEEETKGGRNQRAPGNDVKNKVRASRSAGTQQNRKENRERKVQETGTAHHHTCLPRYPALCAYVAALESKRETQLKQTTTLLVCVPDALLTSLRVLSGHHSSLPWVSHFLLPRFRSHSDETHSPPVKSGAACPVLFTATCVHACQMHRGQGNSMLRVVRPRTHTPQLRLPLHNPLLHSLFV